jgi:polysaccharide biosynthesis transport protein
LRVRRNLPVLAFDAPPARPVPLIPAQMAQSPVSLAQLSALLRAHRREAIIITLLCLALTVVVVKLLPKSYTAEAAVLVNFESNDSTRQVAPDLFNSYLASQVQLLQSRTVFQTVIKRLDLTKTSEFTDGFKDDGTATLSDWVEKQLRQNVSVDQGKGDQLLHVSATSRNRNLAAQIANAVVESYQQRNVDQSNDPTSGRAHEYVQQLADLKAKVTAAESRMAEFRQRTGITDLSGQTGGQQNDIESQALSALEQQLLTAQNARRAAEAKNVADQSSSDQVLASQLIQNLKNQLSTLQAQLAESSATLGPKHPHVVELESQISSTRRALDREIGTFSQNNASEVSNSRQLEGKLQRAVDEQHAKLLKTRQLQDEGQKLQLELESAQTVYKRALDGYDQIMFASSSFVSRAQPPLEASAPNKILLAMIGALISLLLGVGGPVVYELLSNRRLHCRTDMERDLGLPVLAELDGIAA